MWRHVKSLGRKARHETWVSMVVLGYQVTGTPFEEMQEDRRQWAIYTHTHTEESHTERR
jgi:hypothetical protein